MSKLGINGLGRVGKLTLWHHVARKFFDEIVVNLGRSVGSSIRDVAHYIERDSTYGLLHSYLHGHEGKRAISDLNDAENSMNINGIPVKFLMKNRNPKNIDWEGNDIRLLVETTGKFLDPTRQGDHNEGALRGHLDAGVRKVVVSAPFKIKDKGKAMPEDAVTTVMGINNSDYDPPRHRLISNASCTTTCLAHMVKPLINHYGPKKILTASMSTVHAVTGSQEVLDRLAKPGAKDLRKNRSVFNNIILTTTGAANTLRLVIPEMNQIGFIAESVRIPTTTGSLIILVVNLLEGLNDEAIRRDSINQIYKEASENNADGYLNYTDDQNVSCDIIGLPRAAVVIEGHETHTRTAEVPIDLKKILKIKPDQINKDVLESARISVTQAVIYGWYDNELGSYVNMLGDRTVTIAESM